MATTGENVKRLREARGLTQLAVANGIGVGSQTISRLERGETVDPKPANLKALARFFKVQSVEGDDAAHVAAFVDTPLSDSPATARPVVVGEYVRSGRGNPMTADEESMLEAYAASVPDATVGRLHVILMAHRAPLETVAPAEEPQVDPPPEPPKKGGSGPRPLVEITEAMAGAGGSKSSPKRGK